MKFLKEPWESDSLERLSGWHIILAASGMCDAGRVRKHLKRLLWRRDATILLPGYQAQGTLGRILVEGASEVRIQGEDIQVKARVRSMDVYSGHADATALVAWAKARRPIAGRLFLAHGEPDALAALRARLVAEGFKDDGIVTPSLDSTYVLSRAAAEAQPGKARMAGRRGAAGLAQSPRPIPHRPQRPFGRPSRRRRARRPAGQVVEDGFG